MKLLSTAVLCLSLCTAAAAQKTKLEMIHEKCPLMNSATNAAPAPTAQPDPGMMHRGEMGMGFSQTATTHHFLLLPDGGSSRSRPTIRPTPTPSPASACTCTTSPARSQQGDFDIPMFVHDTVPPGVPEMKRLLQTLHFSIDESATGGRVNIRSDNQDAIAAVHKFLIFQIEEHKTGDPIEIPAAPKP